MLGLLGVKTKDLNSNPGSVNFSVAYKLIRKHFHSVDLVIGRALAFSLVIQLYEFN